MSWAERRGCLANTISNGDRCGSIWSGLMLIANWISVPVSRSAHEGEYRRADLMPSASCVAPQITRSFVDDMVSS